MRDPIVKRDVRVTFPFTCEFAHEDYLLAVYKKRNDFTVESFDFGRNWYVSQDWDGFFEVPQCIHTLQLDVSSTIPTGGT